MGYMKESEKRISYIADYIVSYEEKIRLLNAQGLFDSAKLFELFALETCKIIFKKDFINLNIYRFSYPHVDLISNDGALYVQVSTVKDIPAKIKRTLEDIRDSKKDETKNIQSIKFFMLNNDSVDSVKDYKDDNQIGNISFDKENDLITTKTILDKAMNQLDFQIALYELILRDSESIRNNSIKLSETIERCKKIELQNIVCLINDEYEINRNNLVDKIKSNNNQFVAIIGGPGSGKSVIGRKIAETCNQVIFARAERFLECSNINDIWGFNVRETFEMQGESQLVVFIDALEFIADNYQRIDILHELYEIVSKYKNIRIISSCRTSEFNSFIKINKTYLISVFEVQDLNEYEINQIAKRYPIVSKMVSLTIYKELLKNPLYINIIVSQIKDIDVIGNENQLREYIWENVICLKNKAKKLGLKHNEITLVVESIVFDRAKNFLLGSTEKLYDSNIIEALISENILIRNGNTVRLKYDVFEDITFEQYFDSEFDECKGDYLSFFDSISKMGRCVFRRYQIWISNKLLVKENRDKFIAEIVFSDGTPDNWRKQTNIGLIKSRYSYDFFDEYKDLLVSNGVLSDFLKTTNLYGFEIDSDSFKKYFNMLELKPIGQGRMSLIKIVYEKKLYEKEEISKSSIIKLCSDFSKVKDKNMQIESFACRILEYYVEDYLKVFNAKHVYGLQDEIITLLNPIYEMVESSKEWILKLWNQMRLFMQDENKARLAANIIDTTLEAKHVKLSMFVPVQLCELADFYWTHSIIKTKRDHYYDEGNRWSNHFAWGLNKYAEEYDHKNYRSTPQFSSFFFAILKTNYWYGLEWAINLFNKLSLIYAKENKIDSPNCELFFVDEQKHRKYFGDFYMWTIGTKENTFPMIINDFVYLIKEEIKFRLKNEFNTEKKPIEFAEKTKKMIYEQSSNIILLSAISDIGKEFFDIIPGYTVDLISNFDIIYYDLSKTALNVKNPTKELLEKQILLIAGVPNIPNRYKINSTKTFDIRSYAIYCQIGTKQHIKEKSFKILDYLYSITPNDKVNGRNYLQIQNMDTRNAEFREINDGLVEMIPQITGEAKKIAEDTDIDLSYQSIINNAIEDLNRKALEKSLEIKDIVALIEITITNAKDDLQKTVYEKTKIDLISLAISSPELDKNTRSKYCLIWIEGIESYFNNGSFIFENRLVHILFKQIENEIEENVKKRIEKLIIDCILYNQQHGVIYEISTYAKLYLKTNKNLSQAVFNTIAKLAQDEINHQKYNWYYLKPVKNGKEIDFIPNLYRKLSGVDYQMRQNGEVGYESNEDEIIRDFLYEKKELNLKAFDINNYDINLLCNAFNFGASLEDSIIQLIAKSIIQTMINIWHVHKKEHISHEIIDFYSQYEFIEFLRNELVKNIISAKKVLSLLFEDINFEKFTKDTFDFYESIFGILLVVFFDSHGERHVRNKCTDIIDLLEVELLKIENIRVRNTLLKTIILSPISNYSRSDWSKCKADYSYIDKVYLNRKISSYGYLHINETLNVIHKLHYYKLLPEIVISMNNVFVKANDYYSNDTSYISKVIFDNKQSILQILYSAYVDFSDQIKRDKEMTAAFENILEIIVERGHEEFAVILDEFRIH